MWSISSNFAYVIFAIMVYAIFVTVHSRLPKCKRQLNVMFACGGIGGILISQLYRRDFWNPPSIFGYTDGPFYLTIEDFLFGGGFMGIVTLLVSLMPGKGFEKDSLNAATRPQKWTMIAIVVLVSIFAQGAFGLNWVLATSMGFLAGTLSSYDWKGNRLLRAALLGGLATMAVYAVLVGTFLLVLTNQVALAETVCQFYVRNGALTTGALLAFWSFAFGAYFAPFYAFMTGQRYADD